MKKILFICLCALSVIRLFGQDVEKNIEVKINSNEPVIEDFPPCNISLTATQSDDSEVSLSIEIENKNADKDIYLFGHSYTEKELKKEKIRFDNKAYGSAPKEIETCKGLNGDKILKIEADCKETFTISYKSDDSVECKIPLYVVKTKNGKKFYIYRRVILTLHVKLLKNQPVPDESLFNGISQKYEEIKREIGQVRICESKKHRTSIEKQKEPYVNKINALIDEISEIRSQYKWNDGDEVYRPYKEVLEKLKKIEFISEICRIHSNPPPPPPHHCNYCDVTPAALAREIENLYKKLDSKNVTDKSKVIATARSKYNACKGCPNLQKKLKGSDLSDKINRCFSAILK